jgi:hypothetical protein
MKTRQVTHFTRIGSHTHERCNNATPEGEQCELSKHHFDECSFDRGMQLYIMRTQDSERVIIDGYDLLEPEEYSDYDEVGR